MKKVLSVLLMITLGFQLTACVAEVKEEKDAPTLYLNDPIDNSVTEIKVDSENIIFEKGETLAFQSELNISEMADSLSKLNQDYGFESWDEDQLIMFGGNGCRDTLFTKRVFDENGNPIDDVYVVRNESCVANQPQRKMNICFPYSLTNTKYTLSQDAKGTYSLTCDLHEPFYNLTELIDLTPIFERLMNFYQQRGYLVRYESSDFDDLNVGCINVFSNYKNGLIPEFKILLMKNQDRAAMQYCAGKYVQELEAGKVIEKYADALNSKNTEAFLSCFKEIDDSRADDFINSVKKCFINSSELFWADQSRDEYILKVDRNLVSEDGKQIGSFGTGTVYCNDFWVVKMIDGEPKIIGQYESSGDAISELSVYKEFENGK